jgi:hypothetical protein
MNYIELLRQRRALTVYGCVLGGLTLFGLIVFNFTVPPHLEGGVHSGSQNISLSGICGIALFATWIFATVIAASLNRENDVPEMMRTKPFPLEQVAVSYYLTDLAAIAIAFLISVGVNLITLFDVTLVLHIPNPMTYDFADAAVVVTLGLGVAFMWYGLLQAATSSLKGRGGVIVGLSWPVFIGLVGLSHLGLPPALHAIVMFLNVFDPMAYLTSLLSSSSGGAARTGSFAPAALFALDPWIRAGIIWTFGVAACAVAAISWKRLEV